MNAESPQDIDSPQPRPRRSWGLRFSLLTMVLLVTVAALAISHWRMSAELAKKNQRVEQLHESLGIPPVTDPAKVTAVGVPVLEQHDIGKNIALQWHLVIPEGKEFVLCLAVDEIPKKGLPEDVIRVGTLTEGDVRVSLSIEKEYPADPVITIQSWNLSPHVRPKRLYQKATPVNDDRWMEAFYSIEGDSIAGYSFSDGRPTLWHRTKSDGLLPMKGFGLGYQTETFEPDETIILRRTRRFQVEPSNASSDDENLAPDIAPGIMLWLEPKTEESKPAAP